MFWCHVRSSVGIGLYRGKCGVTLEGNHFHLAWLSWTGCLDRVPAVSVWCVPSFRAHLGWFSRRVSRHWNLRRQSVSLFYVSTPPWHNVVVVLLFRLFSNWSIATVDGCGESVVIDVRVWSLSGKIRSLQVPNKEGSVEPELRGSSCPDTVTQSNPTERSYTQAFRSPWS